MKDHRDSLYGHKVYLTGGASNLINECVICKRNSADTTLTTTMFDRQHKLYGRYTLKVGLKDGFATREHLTSTKFKHIKDVCLAKKRGITLEEICRSPRIYKRLRRFRAGMESGISWLKWCFGVAPVNMERSPIL